AARLEAFAGATTGWPPRTPARTLFEAPAGVELTDLIVLADRLVVGLRERDGATVRGATVTLDGAGHVLSRAAGAEHHVAGHRVAERAAAAAPAGRHAPIPWPIVPNSQHPVGNTWGEYQNYGGSPYPHPGVDVLGDPGQPVYAVREGVVKAILTTSGDWHWRIAIGDTASAATVSGYLYAHIDEPTITVQVGDPVVQGQYLGDLVPWPVYDFTHCHFARIEDSGAVWLGDWLATENPHLDLPAQTETEPPVFEPAYGSNLLAFCQNQTSNYLDPAALSGAVDIIAHVGDRILTDWVCTVQTLRYSIHPLGQPAFPVVDERLAVEFDMALDTYQNGPNDPFLVDLLYKQDTTCRTEGDYEAREFYHIITNSNGDTVYEESDLWEAWDTSTLPDGAYVVRVTAIDVAGNAAVDSMVVGTANGNPAAIDPVTDPRPLPPLAIRGVHPNPALAASTITFALGQTGPVALAVYDPAGRLVRRLAAGRLAAGTHSLGWDGTDAYGRRVGSGVYFYALETPVARRVHKLVVSR
ncbi:MAG: FlgD immunoglobulin-like domain containing protein, partial [Candidatus Eiseniibacteriota bacterium]